MNLPRQPQPVKILLTGEDPDVEFYVRLIKRFIENRSYDNVIVNEPNCLTICPAAVND